MKHSKGMKGLSENMGWMASPAKGQPAHPKRVGEGAQAREENGSRSDERRFRDALEDDEVREALQANRERFP